MNQGKINYQNPRQSRKKSVSTSTWKRQDNSNNQEFNTDIKTYRMFMNRFFQTINTFYVKKHKNFFAEIDQYYRVPLSREQRQFLEQNTHKIVERHIDKAKKDMIGRNSQALKKISLYTEEYIKNFGPPQQKQLKKQNKPVQLQSQNKIIRYRPNSSCSRPRSGHSHTQRVSTTKQQMKNMFYPSININKQLEDDVLINGRDGLKFVSKKQNNVQQLYIASRAYRIAANQRSNSGIIDSSANKFLKSQLLPRPTRKSVNEIDKEKIQTRLFMLNRTLGPTVTSTQGYRPKSKCWGNKIKNQKCFF